MATLKKLDKNQYEVRWSEYDADGKRHQGKRLFERKNIADDFMRSLDPNKVHVGKPATFSTWIDEWFEAYKPRIEATTIIGYESIIARCKEHFREAELSKIKPMHIEKFYQMLVAPDHPLSKNPLSSSRAQRHHALLHRAFVFAVRDGLIDFNPCDRVDPPKSSRQEPSLPEMDDLQARLDELKGTALYLCCVLALITGRRESDIMGLKWSDADLKNNKLYICRVRQYLGKKHIDKMTLNANTRVIPNLSGYIERDYTKSKKTYTQTMPAELVALLRAEKKHQAANRLKFGPLYFDSDFICVYEDGQPVGKNAFSRAMKGVCRFHDLRHINGTQSLAAGHDPITVAHRLGNDPQTLIKFYAHLVEEKERKAAGLMPSIIKIET